MDLYNDYLDEYEVDYETVFDDFDGINADEESLTSNVKACMVPSMQQAFSFILKLVGCCLLCRFLWSCVIHLKIGECLQHWISIVCGVLALYCSVGNSFYIVVLQTLCGFVLIQALDYSQYKSMGPMVTTVIIPTHILFEIVFHSSDVWNSVRGIQMVTVMKIISLSFDVDSKKKIKDLKQAPSLIPYLGYIFCPASCAVGLWMSYNAYVRSMQKTTSGIAHSLVWSFNNILLAMLALVISNCLAPVICTNHKWIWLRAYTDAFVVRTSHYFISFASQALLAVNGVKWTNNAVPNAALGFIVCKPWAVELPRSLPSVAREWNLPMHEWLKTYIFKGARNYFNSYFAAILLTFLTSGLLHGLHFQIYAILLSLTFFSYVEHSLRLKLAIIFNACVKASGCRKGCDFRYCDKNFSWCRSFSCFYVKVVNFLFGLLSVFHLAYLGVMLSSRDEGVSSISDGLLRWQKMGYACHWIAAATFIFYHLI